MITGLLLLWLSAISALGQSAEHRDVSQPTQRPSFKDFPVTQVFHGTPAPPVLDTPKARAFRTELRRQAAWGPNFAGHFTVARWGCGAGCTDVAIIDARSGQVWFASFSYEDAWQDGRIVCPHAADFELSSELFIVRGDVSGKIGLHYTAGTIASSLCCRSMNTVGTGREFECYQQAAVSNVPYDACPLVRHSRPTV